VRVPGIVKLSGRFGGLRRVSRRGCALCGLLVFASAGVWPSAAQPEGEGGGAELIPRRVLFGAPERLAPKISPNGERLAFLAPVDNVLNVWVGPADDPAQAEPVTRDTRRGIRTYFWAYTNRHIVYLQDEAGDENWRVYVTDLNGRATRDLTPYDQIVGPDGQPQRGPDGKPLRPSARVQEVSPRFPDEILIGLNQRLAHLHDLHRLNIRTGQLTLVERNDDGFLGYVTDDTFAVRFALRTTPEGGTEMLQARDGSWKLFTAIPPEDALGTYPKDFDQSGQVLYLFDSRERNTSAVVAIDLRTGRKTVISENARSDAEELLLHPTAKNVQAVAYTHKRRHWQITDASIRPDIERLRAAAEGDLSVVSRALDDRRWVVAYEQDDGPTRFYLYDRPSGKVDFLFADRPQLERYPLARMQPLVIRSRDGLELISYLTLPIDADPDGDGRPQHPLPMVLTVHGGPWARDRWGYSPWHQWLANRGYAVLSVNYRGSTGLGKGFTNAGDREWGGKMHDDLIDAVERAVRDRIADPQRVAILGGSYGGYAALVGLTFTPTTFACAVDIVGPSNLVTLIKSVPPYWKPELELLLRRIGDHRTEEGQMFLQSRSPLTYVERIQRPLLIGQGANDPRVRQAESDRIVRAMQEKGIAVTYVLYPDEGHGFVRPENRISFYAVAEAFLARHLGGRTEAIGEDFAGSAITVPAGGEHVPGLAEALAAPP